MTTGLNPPESPTDFDRVNFRQETDRERDFHREQLSAMMDGTLSTDESRFLLRRMQHDAELAGCWERWQLFGDAMRGQTGNALPADFSRRVARAIAVEAEANRAAQSAAFEPAVTTDGAAVAWRQRLRWGGGAALAASVAIAALITTRDLAQDPNPQPAVAIAAAPSTPTTTAAPGSIAAASATPQTDVDAPQTLALSPDEIPKKMANIPAVSSSQSIEDVSDSTSAVAVQAASAPAAAVSSSPSRRDIRPRLRAPGARESRPAALTAQTAPTNDPFGRQTLDLSAKPWPRALLQESAAVGGVTVDYSVAPGVHPSFQPRVETSSMSATGEQTGATVPPASPSPAP